MIYVIISLAIEVSNSYLYVDNSATQYSYELFRDDVAKSAVYFFSLANYQLRE